MMNKMINNSTSIAALSASASNERLIVGYKALADFLTGEGFPISKSVLSKLGAPSVNAGVPVEGFWSNRPAFRPSAALAWCRARLRPVKAPLAEAPLAAETSAPSPHGDHVGSADAATA